MDSRIALLITLILTFVFGVYGIVLGIGVFEGTEYFGYLLAVTILIVLLCLADWLFYRRVATKQGAIEELKKLIELETQDNMLDQVIAFTGDKEFTSTGMLAAIKAGDTYGKQLLQIYQMRESNKNKALSEKKKNSQTITDVAENKGAKASSSQSLKEMPPEDPNLLLIRPDSDTSPSTSRYVTSFSHPASDVIAAKANALIRWNITDLDGDEASRANVDGALRNSSVDLILHYDHGLPNVIFGQRNGGANAIRDPAIDLGNVAALRGKAISTVSCASASILGQVAILNGAKAYLGYIMPIWAPSQGQDQLTKALSDAFIDAANAANSELLGGKTFQEAHEKGIETYWEKFKDLILMWEREPDLMRRFHILWVAGFLLWNRRYLKRLGDPNTHF